MPKLDEYCGKNFPVIDVKKTGQRIRILRQERRISTRELSRYLGLASREAVYHWEHGKCLPTVDNLFALSKYLGVRVEDILVPKEDAESGTAPQENSERPQFEGMNCGLP